MFWVHRCQLFWSSKLSPAEHSRCRIDLCKLAIAAPVHQSLHYWIFIRETFGFICISDYTGFLRGNSVCQKLNHRVQIHKSNAPYFISLCRIFLLQSKARGVVSFTKLSRTACSTTRQHCCYIHSLAAIPVQMLYLRQFCNTDLMLFLTCRYLDNYWRLFMIDIHHLNAEVQWNQVHSNIHCIPKKRKPPNFGQSHSNSVKS